MGPVAMAPVGYSSVVVMLQVISLPSDPHLKASTFFLQCVPQTDAEVLTALMPKIVEILKTGVGFGTKVSSIHQVRVILTISL